MQPFYRFFFIPQEKHLAAFVALVNKILQALAKENILSSFKGAHGGFMLAKKPEELTLKMIVECAEKKQTMVFECSPSTQKCPGGKGTYCRVWPILNKLQTKIDLFLDNMTLKDIIEI